MSKLEQGWLGSTVARRTPPSKPLLAYLEVAFLNEIHCSKTGACASNSYQALISRALASGPGFEATQHMTTILINMRPQK